MQLFISVWWKNVDLYPPPPEKEDFTDSIKFNNAVFNQIMSNKNPVLDNNDIGFENLIDSLTDFSRDTVDWLPPNERNKNNIEINDTNSVDHILLLNTPSCSRILIHDSTHNTPSKNEVLSECSESTHVSKSTEPEQLDLQCKLLDCDGANSIIVEKSFKIGPSLEKKLKKT